MTIKNGSTILALDENNNAYITNEYHYGLGEANTELVTGGIDEGESPLEWAKRELMEESGLMADEWIDLGYNDPITSIAEFRMHMFLARKLHQWEARPDEWEIVNIGKIPVNELFKKAMNGEITHGTSLVCILKAYIILESEK